MAKPKKNKTRRKAGSNVANGREAKATGQRKTRYFTQNYINEIVQEIHAIGLQLRSLTKAMLLATLFKVLQYRGTRGLSKYEGTALGYLLIATRIHDLEADGWLIASLRENVIGPDGLYHPRIARYIFVGCKADSPQFWLPPKEA